MTPTNGKQLSLREAAAILGVSVQTLRRWDRSGKLPSRRNPHNDYRYYLEADLAPTPRDSAATPEPPKRELRSNSMTEQPARKSLDCAPAHELPASGGEEPWLIEGLWAHQGVGIIGGEPKCCKSFLALDIAVSVATGTPCLRQYAVKRPGRVLLFAAEDAHHVVRERLRGICAAAGTDLVSLDVHVVRDTAIRLDLEADQACLRDALARLRPRLLILDPFVRLHGISESAVGEVARVLGFLRELQREFGCAVLLVHHMRKGAENMRGGQALRGSSDLHAWGDSNLYLRRREESLVLHIEHRAAASYETDLALELHQEGSALALRVSGEQPTDDDDPGVDASGRDRIEHVLRAARRPLPFRDLRARTRMKTETFGATLKTLLEDGFVSKSDRGYALTTLQAPTRTPTAASSAHATRSTTQLPVESAGDSAVDSD